MENLGEPQWQPISMLAILTAHAEEGAQITAEHLATLREGVDQPYRLDDATVAGVIATFTTTRTDLVELFTEQGRRWQALDLDAMQRAGVARYVALVAQELALVEQILDTAAQLRSLTIEKLLAKSNLELGLEALGVTRP